MKNKLFFYETVIGKVAIAEKNGKITNLFFDANFPAENDYNTCETEVLKEANIQLQEYLGGNLRTFSLPLEPEGTEFMKNVWNSLLKISYGQTSSYKDIAQLIGSPKAYRAVGSANNKNPIPIIIPCHRVVGSSGDLVGYSGGLKLKKMLLNIEGYQS